MLGLIYKDIVSNKYVCVSTAVFVVVISVLSLSVSFPAFSVMSYVMIYIAGSVVSDTAFAVDRMCKWDVYVCALPTAVKRTVLARFILTLITHLICFVLTVIIAVINMRETRLDLPLLISLFAIITGSDCISNAFSYRFGVKRGGIYKNAILFIIPALAVFYLMFGDLRIFGERGLYDFLDWLLELDLTNITDKAALPAALFGVIAVVLSYLASCKGYRAGLERSEV